MATTIPIFASSFSTMARVTPSAISRMSWAHIMSSESRENMRKAGNVNNGITHASRPDGGRTSSFCGLFAKPDVGIVQTPQHFFSADPIQTNLLCASAWPDKQRFFFEIVMPAKDAWSTAFYCGTSAGFRAEALLATQGMATETVTEDTHTSFKMEEHGYRTIYLKAAQHGARPRRVARLYHPALPLVPWRHSADLHARLPGEHACARSAACRLSMARSIGSSLFLSRSSC
jgi:hypothetical protein